MFHLGGNWIVAGTPGHDKQKQALLGLLGANLLGPVFFIEPPGQDGDEGWRQLRDASRQYGKDPRRRLLLPTASRSDLTQGNPPRVVTMTSGRPLRIGPWGGDSESAYALLRIQGNRFVHRALPSPTPDDMPVTSIVVLESRQPHQDWQAVLADVHVSVHVQPYVHCLRLGNRVFALYRIVDTGYNQSEGWWARVELDVAVVRL